MEIEIYHQLGHNPKWNFDSLKNNSVGKGIIIAPNHMTKTNVENLDDGIKKSSFFDPQFFLPHVRLRTLTTYDFFPDCIADGFQTDTFLQGIDDECAKRCLQFQSENDFCRLIIPTRYLSGINVNYIDQQNQLFVEPFLKAISDLGLEKPILLQLVITDAMVKNEQFRNDLLNWITREHQISGVYLIADVSNRSKQIADIDFLLAYMKFIDALKQNDMYVLLGYQNTESIILSIANPDAISIGSYETQRMFSIRNFEIHENRRIQGPNPRIYFSKLMQWVDHNYLGAIRNAIGDDIIDNNQYQVVMFRPEYEWHFTKPELYQHYFLEFAREIAEISQVNDRARYNLIARKIQNGLDNFGLLEAKGVIFDSVNSGYHLPPWQTAINLFAREKKWRD